MSLRTSTITFPSTEAVLAAGIVESMREFAQEMRRGFAMPRQELACCSRACRAPPDACRARRAAWMLGASSRLAEALRELCRGRFARHDVEAMVTAGAYPRRRSRVGRTLLGMADHQAQYSIAAKHPGVAHDRIESGRLICAFSDSKMRDRLDLQRLRSSGGGRGPARRRQSPEPAQRWARHHRSHKNDGTSR